MTKEFYETNAEEFFNNTFDVDMTQQYKKFITQLKGRHIIDLGCGSGRDSKYFKSLGYNVKSIDNNVMFKELAKEKLGINIIIDDITTYNYKNIDGIWACASLLHVSSSELDDVFSRLYNSLNNNGVIYCSFKLGDFEGERNGRYFNDMTVEKLTPYLKNFNIIETYVTGDVRENRSSEQWLNVICLKK